MKRSLAATATLLVSTVAAPAYELICSAPVVALGEDPRDNNPVVSVEIKFLPEEHSWRVFHYLQNGLVVSRSEQYAMTDASNDSKAQWQGSLNRARNLYMIGEVKRVEGGLVYMEWIYDRNKGNRMVMQSTAACKNITPRLPRLPQPTS
jgi:hypothetical protein